jgi:hypothetical protein
MVCIRRGSVDGIGQYSYFVFTINFMREAWLQQQTPIQKQQRSGW